MQRKAAREVDFTHGVHGLVEDADVSDSAPLLQLENIVKNYGAIVGAAGHHFRHRGGRVIALLGDNNAGKSTLMKIIAGGLSATSGRIVFGGVDPRFESPADAKAACGSAATCPRRLQPGAAWNQFHWSA